MSLIPKEVLEKLDHAADSMDEMNNKLSIVIEYLSAINDELRKQEPES